MDNRAEATTGYWHKLFTCKTTATANTNICLTLSVIGFYPGQSIPNGILTLNIRQNASGIFEPAASVFKWQSTTIDMTNFLNRFAISVVTSTTGNYVEFYIYNNTQYTGYKVSVIDRSVRGTGNLTFTGEVTSSATTTLTSLPTDGSIAYSTLSNSIGNVPTASSQSGYTILPGGLKMCWGTVNITPTAADVATAGEITYPITFDYNPSIQVAAYTGAPHAVSVSASSITKTGAIIYMTRSNTTSTGLMWMAIGK